MYSLILPPTHTVCMGSNGFLPEHVDHLVPGSTCELYQLFWVTYELSRVCTLLESRQLLAKHGRCNNQSALVYIVVD